MEMKDYGNGLNPTWCKGCGHFSILRSLQTAASRMNIPREMLSVVSGIGCSGRISGYMNAYSFHSVHGRSLPVAQGIKLANPDLTVVAAGGDGDGFAIGTSHTVHAIRRNIDMTYIVMNNQVYGLTKGHVSPASYQGLKTITTPNGSVDMPVKPGLLALASGASFYAQGFSAQQEELIELIQKAIRHPGFSLVQVFSPCVTYNKVNTYQWFREHLKSVDEVRKADTSDYLGAMQLLKETEGLCTGIVYQSRTKASYEELHQEIKEKKLTGQKLHMTEDLYQQITEHFTL